MAKVDSGGGIRGRGARGRRTLAAALGLVAVLAAVLVVVLLTPSTRTNRTAVSQRSGSPDHTTGRAQIRVVLHPAVVLRGQISTIVVSGIEGSSPQVQLAGATTNLGHVLPWTALRRSGSGWQARLPVPEFRGVYRIRLRSSPNARTLGSDDWLLRVYAKGMQGRPLLETPEAVARSWVQGVSARASVVAIKRWPLPEFDHRDPYLHQILVVAYTLEGHRRVSERLGVFVTAVREASGGRWRLLEATAAPQ